MNIKSIFSAIIKIVSIIAAVPLIFIFIFVFFSGPIPSCTEDSDAVIYARSLSPERLATLYSDMQRYYQNDNNPIGGYYVSTGEMAVPKEFSNLKVTKVRPNDANIMIEGCFDHYVYLHFEGYKYKDLPQSKKIILSWGKHSTAGKEVLWSKNAPNKKN